MTILIEEHLFFTLFTKFLKTRSDSYFRSKTVGNRVRTLGSRNGREMNRLHSVRFYSAMR